MALYIGPPKDVSRGRPKDVGRRRFLPLHRGPYGDVIRTSVGDALRTSLGRNFAEWDIERWVSRPKNQKHSLIEWK